MGEKNFICVITVCVVVNAASFYAGADRLAPRCTVCKDVSSPPTRFLMILIVVSVLDLTPAVLQIRIRFLESSVS